MNHVLRIALIFALVIANGTVFAKDRAHFRHHLYKVTITNLTYQQSFTPILAVTHPTQANLLFNLGEAASEQLGILAAGGDTVPLQELLQSTSELTDTSTSPGLLGPGESVSLEIEATRKDRLSLAAMLIPTNDAFFSFQNLPMPLKGHSAVTRGPAYDAGVELNDELCINIPGPVCGGTGVSPEQNGEGFVHIHRGIHGIGDLGASEYDWRNPVARVEIVRAD